MNHDPRNPSEPSGDDLKHDALERHYVRRPALIRLAQRALLSHLMRSGAGTIEDVRDVVELPEGLNPKSLGAVPGTLARGGIIRRVGYVTAQRPAAHARPLSLWELADADAARQWLATHPELHDDTCTN